MKLTRGASSGAAAAPADRWHWSSAGYRKNFEDCIPKTKLDIA
jgi:hypothetical protein